MNAISQLFAQTSNCTLNGQPVPCDQLAESAGGVIVIFIIIWGLMAILGIASLVIWIMSLVHVLTHEDVKDRTMWIIIILLAGGIGGIIYYFVIKRPYDKNKTLSQNINQQPPQSTPPVINQ